MARKPKLTMRIDKDNLHVMNIEFGHMSLQQIDLARDMAKALREKGYLVRGTIIHETEEEL